MENNLRDDNGLSPTRAIYLRLKPLWEAGDLHDRDWAYVLAGLRKIETRCTECKELAEADQRIKCVTCMERKLIEAI